MTTSTLQVTQEEEGCDWLTAISRLRINELAASGDSGVVFRVQNKQEYKNSFYIKLIYN